MLPQHARGTTRVPAHSKSGGQPEQPGAAAASAPATPTSPRGLIFQLEGSRTNAAHAAPPGTTNQRCSMRDIDAHCLGLFRWLQPAPDELARLYSSFDAVGVILKREFPDGRVHLFGSAANGLCITQNNDIDVTLHIDGEAELDRDAKAALIEKLGEALEGKGTESIKVLASARVPVLKFVMSDAGTAVDITINNELPLRNTELIRTYVSIDERLRQLIFIVKYWAKQRHINDAFRGTLSSYAWVMCCIFLAQRAGLVPVLQEEQPFTVDTTVAMNGDSWHCRYNAEVQRHAAKAAEHPVTVGGLLTMFFDYYAHRFDFNTEIICPARGRPLLKEEVGWVKKIGSERHVFCIQDPFLLSHDLGRTVDGDTRRTLQGEFQRAARIMYTEAQPIRELIKQYTYEAKSAKKPHGKYSNNKYPKKG